LPGAAPPVPAAPVFAAPLPAPVAPALPALAGGLGCEPKPKVFAILRFIEK